jgi:hypothetical protein
MENTVYSFSRGDFVKIKETAEVELFYLGAQCVVSSVDAKFITVDVLESPKTIPWRMPLQLQVFPCDLEKSKGILYVLDDAAAYSIVSCVKWLGKDLPYYKSVRVVSRNQKTITFGIYDEAGKEIARKYARIYVK